MKETIKYTLVFVVMMAIVCGVPAYLAECLANMIK